MAGGNIDLRGCSGEKSQLFQRDIPGFLAENVNGLIIENFRLEWTGTRMPFFTNGIEVNNFKDLNIKNFMGTASPLNTKAFPILVSKGTGFVTDAPAKSISKNGVK